MKHDFYSNTKLAQSINTIIIFGALIVVFGTFAQQQYAQGFNFWLIWCLKNFAALVSLCIPLVLGLGSGTSKFNNQLPLIVLSLLWIIMIILNLFSLSSGSTIGSLYLVKHTGPSLLCYLSLLIIGPSIKSYLQTIPFSKLRKLIGEIAIVYLASILLIGTQWLGIASGQTIIAYLVLFTIGVWISIDPIIKQLRTRILILVTGLLLVLSTFISWMNTNVVHYDPHHGLTTTMHYLDGISLNQPLMIITGVGLVIICQRFCISSNSLTPSAITLLGSSYLWLMYPQVLSTDLSFFIRKVTDWPLTFTIPLIIILAIMMTIGTHFVIHLVSILISKINISRSYLPHFLKQITIHAWRTWFFLGIAWLITVISIWHLWDWQLDMLQWVVLNRELVIFINVFMLYAFFAILMAIFNRYWIASITTLTSYAIWLVINMIKISSRSEPVLPADASMVFSLGSIQDLFKLVSPLVVTGLIVIFLLACTIAGVLQHLDSTSKWQLSKRVIMVLLSVILLSYFQTANHPNSIAAKGLTLAKDRPYFYSQLRGAKLNGTLLQFANNIDVTIMQKPAGYSKSAMQKLQKKISVAG